MIQACPEGSLDMIQACPEGSLDIMWADPDEEGPGRTNQPGWAGHGRFRHRLFIHLWITLAYLAPVTGGGVFTVLYYRTW